MTSDVTSDDSVNPGTGDRAGGADPAAKPVDDWVTGDEPMTAPQRSYLETLAREAGEGEPDPSMTKADASKQIERLQAATGRGEHADDAPATDDRERSTE